MSIATPPGALDAVLGRVDDLADRTFAAWKVPGLVYGVIRDGELIHTRALGTLRVGEDAVPTPDSVFRIASMTKSFTAATILLLRDEGRLRLDDPAADHVPELAELDYPTADSPPITIRDLLRHTSGLPTDDPWGDRQQGLDLDAFRRLLAGGLSFAWAPGIRFEYSNTGYGILGRVITNVAGKEYRDVVRERLLQPLGMDSSGYLEEEVEPSRLARGYVWRDGGYVAEPMDGYGALASMGGLFTTLNDLARWVAGFTDAWPPRDEPDLGHPLRRASRREMQSLQVATELRVSERSADGMPEGESVGYGFGLFTADDVRFGRVVGHGGGYPGFGSHMRWHPASGIGVVGLGNGRYAPVGALLRDQLAELIAAEIAPIRRTRPNRATESARAEVEALLERWDDDRAAKLFAMNVELDEPLEQRRVAIEQFKARHGTLSHDDTEPLESLTPYHLVWWLKGERGRVRVEILLSPQRPPKVQTLALTSIPDPSPELCDVAGALVGMINAAGQAHAPWPENLPVTADLDVPTILRAARATEARFAPVSLGPAIDGDGEQRTTFRLESARGRVELRVGLDEAGCLASVGLVPAPQVLPNLD